MRAEPDTPASCCDRNEEMGWKCDPDSCQRRIQVGRSGGWLLLTSLNPAYDPAQNDETALNVDVGYYLDFDVDAATGRPRGCPSFESKANGGKLRVGGQHFLVNCISYASLLVYSVVRTIIGKAATWWTARRTATRPRASPCTRLSRSSRTTRRPGSRS